MLRNVNYDPPAAQGSSAAGWTSTQPLCLVLEKLPELTLASRDHAIVLNTRSGHYGVDRGTRSAVASEIYAFTVGNKG